MSVLRALRVKLGTQNVGILYEVDEWVYFGFDEAYILNPKRPTLSVALLGATPEETAAGLINPPDLVRRGQAKRRLPLFFRNLLPEGILRKQLLAEANLDADDEMGLLAYCGEDLPGNVWAVHLELDQPAIGRLLTQGHDSYEFSSTQLPLPEAVSLSGVQPKVELMESQGRYVMRSSMMRLDSLRPEERRDGAHFIGKLPASEYPGLPEVEYTALQLACAAGVKVAQAELLPLSAIADTLPFTLRDDARHFLLVRRFDRDADTSTGRLHMEDFAQALSLEPEDKYRGDYASIGLVLQELDREAKQADADVVELLRRIKVNELLGNYDAHTKNFSLLFNPDGIPALSPAYDIVAYSAYLHGRGHALRFFPEQELRPALTPVTVRALANLWRQPERKLSAVLKDVVDRAMRSWPGLIAASPMSGAQKEKVMEHLFNHPDARAWSRRQKKAG